MPPFFDGSQLRNAITAQAVPALERLAAYPNHLDRSRNNRFENDEPPPYVSSSESEEDEALYHPVLARSHQAVMEEYKELINEPLNDDEFDRIEQRLHSFGLYTPGTRFNNEARRENEILDKFFLPREANGSFYSKHLKGLRGQQKRAVIVRRNIRKRWQRLGIWNPEWGIPGRVNEQPKDSAETWNWKWQSSADPPAFDDRHPIARAIQLRKALKCGEHAPPIPRSHLREDASPSEAESFIISRPWFNFSMERVEYQEREFRIPHQQRVQRDSGEDDQVTKWWKQRGDWGKDWELPGSSGRPLPGWKWRHESPSPEPEDLSILETDEVDYTPSEIDALDAIRPATPPRRNFGQPFPSNNNTANKPIDIFGGVGAGLFGGPVPLPEAASPHEEPALEQVDESEDQLVETEQEDPNPAPRRRGRPRKTQQPNEVKPQQPDEAPPVRRSARIAAKNANQTPAPAARATRTHTAKAAVVVADAPRKRGRPRKTENAVSKPAAAPKKRGRKPNSAKTAAIAAALDEETTNGASATGKRGRGRPRRTQ